MKHEHKCCCEDCQKIVESSYLYCSIECACYDGTYSVTKGIIDQQKIDKHYAVLADN